MTSTSTRGITADGSYFYGALKGHALVRFDGYPYRGSVSQAVCECGHKTRPTIGGRKYSRHHHGTHKADVWKSLHQQTERNPA